MNPSLASQSTSSIDPLREWLEADGLGGFASGTMSRLRTRRYHGLLLVATKPPAGRVMLVNDVEAWIETANGRTALSSSAYHPDVVHPDGRDRIVAFDPQPWPTWSFRVADGVFVRHELFAVAGSAIVAMRWSLVGEAKGARLIVRPLLSGRDFHATHHENPNFDFTATAIDHGVAVRPYRDLPAVKMRGNGAYRHAPEWYRNYRYDVERERGLEDREDLGSPGEFVFEIDSAPAVMILEAASDGIDPRSPGLEPRGRFAPLAHFARLERIERERRERLGGPLERAADAYVVRRGGGRTIIAGYPWFGDWGRDTFIALRGLCLATGRFDEARAMLVEWAGVVSQGMLPNRFPDGGEAPEYNSVDASLWYVVAAGHFLDLAGKTLSKPDRARIGGAIESILEGYARGTRFGIRMDVDGLLACGEVGVDGTATTQLTWMDAKVGDHVMTPRVGKPVEIQALWVNALTIGARFDQKFAATAERATVASAERFWNESAGCLYDVVDVDHRPGAVDASLRPNQLLAVGGLPVAWLVGERARRVVDVVLERLMTPLGPRSLDARDPRYAGRYEGGPAHRDSIYHQGPVWPWLLGGFVDAFVRVRGGDRAARDEAQARFIGPLRDWMRKHGASHLPEITDGDSPHIARGCPFQAWSLGELLWAEQQLR